MTLVELLDHFPAWPAAVVFLGVLWVLCAVILSAYDENTAHKLRNLEDTVNALRESRGAELTTLAARVTYLENLITQLEARHGKDALATLLGKRFGT